MKKSLTEKIIVNKILMNKILIKKILIKKIKYYQKLPNYRRNFYLTHKK